MKHQYNQGDIAQYTHYDGDRELFVITKVFERPGGLLYEVHWLTDNTKHPCKIKDLDDNLSVTLLARGQQ